MHDAPVFDPINGPPKSVPTGYTQAFADALIKEAQTDQRIVAITAAMPGPTGLIAFQSHFPDRFFDVGIAEQHAVTFAAGLAMGGMRPVVAIYSTFLNRAWDQLVYDVALHRLPVIFCLDRAGVTGDDGPSHHGVYDMALLSKVPGMRVLAPSSAQDLQQMLHDALSLADTGPVVIRYPKGNARQVAEHEIGSGLSARRMASDPGKGLCILAVGKMVAAAHKAAESLVERGVDATLWDVRSCVPLDPRMLDDAARHGRVVTVEDGVRDGGIGSMIATEIASRSNTHVTILGVPTKFLPQSKPDRLLSQLGLDADGIASSVLESLD
ncbi:MAG: hypothetical protein EBV80_02675 [Acidimicrobiia bacterium]|nr:hypothetical protein [Acidimicrobiia bacterium]